MVGITNIIICSGLKTERFKSGNFLLRQSRFIRWLYSIVLNLFIVILHWFPVYIERTHLQYPAGTITSYHVKVKLKWMIAVLFFSNFKGFRKCSYNWFIKVF